MLSKHFSQLQTTHPLLLSSFFILHPLAAAAGQDDQEFSSFEQIMAKPAKKRTFAEKVQAGMYTLMQKTGFFGILLCASVSDKGREG